jgi:hypothetical protein
MFISKLFRKQINLVVITSCQARGWMWRGMKDKQKAQNRREYMKALSMHYTT